MHPIFDTDLRQAMAASNGRGEKGGDRDMSHVRVDEQRAMLNPEVVTSAVQPGEIRRWSVGSSLNFGVATLGNPQAGRRTNPYVGYDTI